MVKTDNCMLYMFYHNNNFLKRMLSRILHILGVDRGRERVSVF